MFTKYLAPLILMSKALFIHILPIAICKVTGSSFAMFADHLLPFQLKSEFMMTMCSENLPANSNH